MRKLHTIEMHRITAEEFHRAEKTPLAVVLDDVRSMHNVGSVFRTCDAFRAAAICLCGITACPPHREIHKTALGAEDSVAWQHFDNALQAIDHLHAQGYTVYALEQCQGSTMLPLPPHFDLPPKVAVVLGNEVKGVSQAAIDRCDGCFEIPQSGTKHSMNVSVAAGIIIWELVRRRATLPKAPQE